VQLRLRPGLHQHRHGADHDGHVDQDQPVGPAGGQGDAAGQGEQRTDHGGGSGLDHGELDGVPGLRPGAQSDDVQGADRRSGQREQFAGAERGPAQGEHPQTAGGQHDRDPHVRRYPLAQ
jgi:hypothetical protein